LILVIVLPVENRLDKVVLSPIMYLARW
jgi:hypothetical protein